MDEIVVEQRGHAAWITLNRPSVRNALSLAVNRRLAGLAEELKASDAVRAIVITGAGELFCAGADLKERKGVPAKESGPYIDAIGGAINGWGAIDKPTICAMNGSAYGGGLELALACDLRILVEGAELGLTEVKLGIMPGAGGTQRLPRIVGEARAKELILFGRRIDAKRALEIGLVNAVVPRDQLVPHVEALVAELDGCAPLSVRQAKLAIERGYGRSMADGLAIERAAYDVTLVSEDRDEGLRAFAEKRPPRYQGR